MFNDSIIEYIYYLFIDFKLIILYFKQFFNNIIFA